MHESSKLIAKDVSPGSWISFEQLAKSFESIPPMPVAFDIDDTIMFSSPAFHYGRNKYSPNDHSFLKNINFWNELNNDLNGFSMPKLIGQKLLNLHKFRGDQIFFITARWKTPQEKLSQYISETFKIENMNPVVFTGCQMQSEPKLPTLMRLNIKLFYGDSDQDIQAGLAASIRTIRILRAPNSNYLPFHINGKFGEEVLKDSAF